jgi:hypothetical protein
MPTKPVTRHVLCKIVSRPEYGGALTVLESITYDKAPPPFNPDTHVMWTNTVYLDANFIETEVSNGKISIEAVGAEVPQAPQPAPAAQDQRRKAGRNSAVPNDRQRSGQLSLFS